MSNPSAVTARRQDANRIALRAVRSILDAAHPMELEVEGAKVKVEVTRQPPMSWPIGGLEGLDEATDGPLPASVRVACTWAGGRTEFLMSPAWWSTTGAERHFIGLKTSVVSPSTELIWITLATRLAQPQQRQVAYYAWFNPAPRQNEDRGEVFAQYGLPVKVAVQRSGLSNVTGARVDAFLVDSVTGAVTPSPEEAYRRLVLLGLLKQPLVLRGGYEQAVGKPLYDLKVLAAEGAGLLSDEPARSGDRLGIGKMPGGVREYKKSLDVLLRELAQSPLSREQFLQLLSERFGVGGASAWHTYGTMLQSLGVVTVSKAGVALGPDGEAYLQDPSPRALFALLRERFVGILETLVVVEQGATRTATIHDRLCQLIGAEWDTFEQSNRRRDWLLSLGALERERGSDALTELGRQLLQDYDAAAEDLRSRLRSLDLEQDGEAEDVLDEEPAARASPGVRTVPSGWEAERVVLQAAKAAAFVGSLEVPRFLLEQACAALSAGKHLLLVGPPGTGKTELAHVLAEAAKADNYCSGAFVTTASADWTTFETMGGYALQRDHTLKLRRGAFLQAIERNQWWVIDELNRADVDRAFGELMTVLSGRSTQTTLEQEDGRLVSIGSDADCTHRVFGSFRVIATMNTWDKTSLFRLSHAVQRRFAVLHVDVPDDATYGRLLAVNAMGQGIDPALPSEAVAALQHLFSRQGLLAHRAIGPAIALDVVRYMRRRQASGDGLAEALQMLLFPQLEGLDQDAAVAVLDLLVARLTGWTSPDALQQLRQRYQDLFPHLRFKAA